MTSRFDSKNLVSSSAESWHFCRSWRRDIEGGSPMEAWRAGLLRELEEDLWDDEDELMEDLIMQQILATSEFLLNPPTHGGSRPGRSANVQRDRELGQERIWKDYFCDNPVYGEALFRKRYRMSRNLFNRILAGLCAHDKYFVQKRDATGLLGLSSTQKVAAALRMLAHGATTNNTDEYCRLGQSTSTECMKRFVRAVRDVFEAQYLRQPTRAEIDTELRVNERRGFSGMFASLDCMDYRWKNSSVVLDETSRSIIVEAAAGHDLWFWHAFFGIPGGNNAINVLERSPLVANLLHSEVEDRTFTVNDTTYSKYYLLVDEIYPKWPIFVQTIAAPAGEKQKHFARMQEGTRKDVKRAFDALQSRFVIVQNPSRKWSRELVLDVLLACVVLHNMIIEDERGQDLESLVDGVPNVPLRRGLTFEDNLKGAEEMGDVLKHYALRDDLTEHLWTLRYAALRDEALTNT